MSNIEGDNLPKHNMDDDESKPKCNCAIFGIFNCQSDASQMVYYGLHALQHRGQESAGIVSFNYDVSKRKSVAHMKKGFGLVLDVFNDPSVFTQLVGTSAIGHTRYSTSGSDASPHNIQPFLVNYKLGHLAVAHNGNISNSIRLRRQFIEQGTLFHSTSDSELVLHFMAHSEQKTQTEQLLDALENLEGAYSFLILTETCLYAVRDPNGFRPLVLGRLGDPNQEGGAAYVLASETCAFDLIGATFVREIEAGEVLAIDKAGCEAGGRFQSHRLPQRFGVSPCVFEYIYFARPDSMVFGELVNAVRHCTGLELAREFPVPAVGEDDEPVVVMPVPDSANIAALGFAKACQAMGLKCSYEVGLIRNHYVGRTFISPNQNARELKVRCKFNTVKRVLNNRVVVMIDDSIVRGTTSKQMIKMVRAAGAKEVHFRVASPPVISPCFYGMDFPSRRELIANSFPNDAQALASWLNADSVGYLSVDGMMRAVKQANSTYQTYCTACFTDQYPVPIQDVSDSKTAHDW
eukprot:TRINITY_DN1315_c0_g6_i1.p1 TRINITY_DN1315_c0_g6~~TRINITY_DN1315_c0_g6_i1.p1  ORF type:complete len:520 (+),score=165.27 TRINITY_DN1315_c0_g6_i1:89-1648(+)